MDVSTILLNPVVLAVTAVWSLLVLLMALLATRSAWRQ